MKTTLAQNAKKTRHPIFGLIVALASICVFLALLVLITVAVHFVMM